MRSTCPLGNFRLLVRVFLSFFSFKQSIFNLFPQQRPVNFQVHGRKWDCVRASRSFECNHFSLDYRTAGSVTPSFSRHHCFLFPLLPLPAKSQLLQRIITWASHSDSAIMATVTVCQRQQRCLRVTFLVVVGVEGTSHWKTETIPGGSFCKITGTEVAINGHSQKENYNGAIYAKFTSPMLSNNNMAPAMWVNSRETWEVWALRLLPS